MIVEDPFSYGSGFWGRAGSGGPFLFPLFLSRPSIDIGNRRNRAYPGEGPLPFPPLFPPPPLSWTADILPSISHGASFSLPSPFLCGRNYLLEGIRLGSSFFFFFLITLSKFSMRIFPLLFLLFLLFCKKMELERFG